MACFSTSIWYRISKTSIGLNPDTNGFIPLLFSNQNDRDKWSHYHHSSFGRVSSIGIQEVLTVQLLGLFVTRLSTWIKAFASVIQSHCIWRRARQVKQDRVIYELDIFKAVGFPLNQKLRCNISIFFPMQLYQISDNKQPTSTRLTGWFLMRLC